MSERKVESVDLALLALSDRFVFSTGSMMGAAAGVETWGSTAVALVVVGDDGGDEWIGARFRKLVPSVCGTAGSRTGADMVRAGRAGSNVNLSRF